MRIERRCLERCVGAYTVERVLDLASKLLSLIAGIEGADDVHYEEFLWPAIEVEVAFGGVGEHKNVVCINR